MVPVVPAASAAPGDGDDVAALQRFDETGKTFGYLSSSDFLTFVHNAENGIREKGLFEGRGPIAILLLVLVGGLALNLTPCVLPMIPINLAIIGAGTRAGSRSRGFLLGGTYGAAMALVYGVLGLIVVLTASTFGTINSSLVVQRRHRPAVRRPRAGDVRRHRHRLLAILEQRPVRRVGQRLLRHGIRHGGRRGAARRRLRRARGDSGRAVLERPVRDRHESGARAAVPARRRHGHSLAGGGRGHRRAAQAGRVDGANQAGLRRRDPRRRRPTTATRRTTSCRTAGSMRPRSRRASRRNSSKAGTRRCRKGSRPPSARTSRS